MTLREAAQQALEALEQQRVFTIRPDHEGKEVTPANVTNAITALRAALAEPTQEELRRLHALNAELVEALREIEWSNSTEWQRDRARAALAKAEAQR